METYLITYDLRRPGQNYPGLHEAIRHLSNGYWWHHLDSTWLIRSPRSAADIRDAILRVIDSTDGLLVSRVGAPAAWAGIKEEGSSWLRGNLN